MKDKELQEKYLEFQILNQQVKQTQQQLTVLEQQIIEFKTLDDNLDEIKKTKAGKEILIPLGAGLFTKGDLKDSKEILMNVGAEVIVKKTIPEAKQIIKRQIDQMENLVNQMIDNLQKTAVQTQILQEDIENLSKEE